MNNTLPKSGRITIHEIVRSGIAKLVCHQRHGKITEQKLLGVTGEIIFSTYLSELQIMHEMHPDWLGKNPVEAYDIFALNQRFDVKTFVDGYDLMIPKTVHENSDKMIDQYVWIQLLDKYTAKYWMVDYHSVSGWEIKKGKFANSNVWHYNYAKPIKSF
jgi:hypothetical protein